MIEPGPQVESLIQDGIPRWDAIDFDVLCSRCGYNLRTLSKPRCPECGIEFDWGEELGWAALGGDFLFERQWRRRPIRSYCMTLWRSMRPHRFWQGEWIRLPVRATPLCAMLIGSSLWPFVLLHGCAWLLGQSILAATGPVPGAALSTRGFTTSEILILVGSVPFLTPLDYWPPLLGILAIVWGSLWGMTLWLANGFGEKRIAAGHILRLIALVSGPLCFCGSIFLAIFLICVLATPSFVESSLTPLTAITALPSGCIAIAVAFLSEPFRVYLVLPRPRILAACAAAVSTILVFACLQVMR